MKRRKVAIVTGASSGIGFETAVILARNGFMTYATMRNLGKSSRLSELAIKEKIDIKKHIIRKVKISSTKIYKLSVYRDCNF